ncbi:MAG TPA: hypothetical protein VMA34_21690 [Terracidiphilus sp.]|nr:hypothetical protein [Terracidiphilus sp.]
MKTTVKRSLVICPLIVLLCSLRATSQSHEPSSNGLVLTNPTPRQVRLKPSITTHNAYGTIQAAIDSQPGPVQIYLSCGVYLDNVVITTSDVRLIGEERACVQIEPADPTKPVVTIDSTNSGTGGIHFDEVSDLSIICPTNMTCADGLKIVGRLDINQPNDFHKFSRIAVYGAFQNGVDLAGRTIWTEFDNMEVEYARGNGINVVSSGVTNALTFRHVRTDWNNDYGLYLDNTQIDGSQGVLLDTFNSEYNGMNTSLHDCAGVYLTGVVQANIENSYFEGDCEGNTADNRAAELRITGMIANSVNVIDTAFNLQYGEGGIYNDAFLTSGMYTGDKFDTTTNNFTIYISTSHALSNVIIGANFNSTPTIVPDANGLTHVRRLSPLGLDYVPVASVVGNTINVASANAIVLYNGPYTINNFVGATIGQILYVMALNSDGHILTNGAGGIGQVLFPDGMNRTLNAGESLMLYFDGINWRPIEGAISTEPRYLATITTTASASDAASVPGITGSAHCMFSARNAIAGSLTGSYLFISGGTLTLAHQPIAGGVFDIFCSAK